jgi:phage gp46-like protein
VAKIEVPDDLVALQREALAAAVDAKAAGYSLEAWRPWIEAAAVVQNAIAEQAAAAGVNRYELEMAVKQAAKG